MSSDEAHTTEGLGLSSEEGLNTRKLGIRATSLARPLDFRKCCKGQGIRDKITGRQGGAEVLASAFVAA